MKSPFRSQMRVTQKFGERPDYYKKFCLKGHEGIDGVPTGTVLDVLCLADGVVVVDDDVAADALKDAYGKFVTVWHPTLNRATQYCHLKENYVKLGEKVISGQKLGLMGATGNTQGAHLHLNLFEVDSNGIRANRANGFLGGVDPLPWIESLVDNPVPVDTVLVEKVKFEDLERSKRVLNTIRERLNVPDSETVIYGEIDKLLGYESKVTALEKENIEKKLQIESLEKALAEQKNLVKEAQEQVLVVTIELQKAQKLMTELDQNRQIMQMEIDQLKKNLIAGLSGWQLIVKGFVRLFVR